MNHNKFNECFRSDFHNDYMELEQTLNYALETEPINNIDDIDIEPNNIDIEPNNIDDIDIGIDYIF